MDYTATPKDQAVITDLYNQLATGQEATNYVEYEQVDVAPLPAQPAEDNGSVWSFIFVFAALAFIIYLISKS